jgi:pimeloyl-ACP methyl ester carboxylesterase
LLQDARAYDLLGLEQARTVAYPVRADGAPRLSLTDLADHVAAQTRGQLDLVGVALGGIVAQHLIVRHPGRVRSAVLANTTVGVGDRATLAARAEESGRVGLPNLVDPLLQRWFRADTVTADTAGVRYVRELLNTVPTEVYVDTVMAMADHDIAADLRGAPLPVTLVTGADDGVGPGSIDRLHELLPNSRVLSIPGSHMVHLDNPEGFRTVVEQHLGWVTAQPETSAH